MCTIIVLWRYDNMCDYNNYEHMATNENVTVW